MVATSAAVVSFVSWLSGGQGWWWAVGLLVLGIIALAGSWQAWVRYRHAGFSESLLIAAASCSPQAATAVPLPREFTSAGAPQLAAAAAVLAAIAIFTRGGPRGRAEGRHMWPPWRP